MYLDERLNPSQLTTACSKMKRFEVVSLARAAQKACLCDNLHRCNKRWTNFCNFLFHVEDWQKNQSCSSLSSWWTGRGRAETFCRHCVCACVSVCVHVCVRECMCDCVCLLTQKWETNENLLYPRLSFSHGLDRPVQVVLVGRLGFHYFFLPGKFFPLFLFIPEMWTWLFSYIFKAPV